MTKLKYISEITGKDYSSLSAQLVETRSNIGILKGACYGLPNPQLLLSPTMMREALESSEIENIVTTLTDALQAQLFDGNEQSLADKEVNRYHHALEIGLKQMQKTYLGQNTIEKVHDTLIPFEPGFRKSQNTLVNKATGRVVYEPVPTNLVKEYMSDLEKFINNDRDGMDPVIKTILAHYQFEKIHPFGDGNGRTGRILLVLCLMHHGLLDLPVLFISEYINNHKDDYYRVFREASAQDGYLPFVQYMLDAFNAQAQKSTEILLGIKILHEATKHDIRQCLPKIYSRDLIDTIFSQPLMTATRYKKLMKVTYPTAQKHLHQLEKSGFMKSTQVGRYRIYANLKLMKFLNQKS